MILLDANVFMYAAGREHRHRRPSLDLLKRVATGKVEACTDAEVLQEILHRYRAIRRWGDGGRVFDLVVGIVPRVLPVDLRVMRAARLLLESHPGLVARDAVHGGVVQVHGLAGVCSWDTDFDRVVGVERILPDAPRLQG